MIEARERVQLHPVERLRPSLKSVFPAIWRLIRRRPLIVITAVLIAIDSGFIAIQIAVDATDYGFNGAYRLDTIGSVLPHVLQIAVEDGGELLVLSGIFLISVVWSTQPNELADGSRG